jgi:guanylate kinase
MSQNEPTFYEQIDALDAVLADANKRAPTHRLYMIVGPSGTGKSTLAKTMTEEGIVEVVSHTTRAPREGEIPGRSYHFVSGEEFEKLVNQGQMLEHVTYSGNRYGVSRAAVEQAVSHGPACIVVEGHGAIQIKKALGDDAVHIFFLVPPPPDVLRARMLARGDDAAKVDLRLATVRDEVAFTLGCVGLVDTCLNAALTADQVADEALGVIDDHE